MEDKIITMMLPEGSFVTTVTAFDESDVAAVNAIYDSWRDLCIYLGVLDSGEISLPEEFAEISFAIAKDLWRCTREIYEANYSFDFYDPNAGMNYNRIYLKTCSVLPDSSLFSPNSEWDRVFLADFYREGKWDGTFDIYEINTDEVNNYKVDFGKTVLDRKIQGRNSKFSIYNGLIQKGKYLSRETFIIINKGIIKL